MHNKPSVQRKKYGFSFTFKTSSSPPAITITISQAGEKIPPSSFDHKHQNCNHHQSQEEGSG
jgi:hypothetical protein